MDPRPGVMVTPALRLLEPLREGAMGSVWVADHLERGERVAVKFVSSQGANEDPESATRLRREAKAALRVESNHVVRVVDHGETEDGTPYVAMELLHGESVGERVRRSGPMALDDVVMVVEQAGDAIEAAHKAGIVHRDIKPDNLFLTKDNGALHVKVLDFGFARAIELPDTTRGLTAPGMMVGTPKLVSPDQLLNPTRVTPSRDLWALAIVAYYALTGVYPFEADPLPELLKRILVCEHTPPSQLTPGLPPELDAWFARALARDPNARFGTAAELIDALRAAAAMPKQPYFPDSQPTARVVAETLADAPRGERSGTNEGITYRRRTMSDEIEVDEEEPLDAELVSVIAPDSEPPPPPSAAPPSAAPPSAAPPSQAHPPSSRATPTAQPILEICILELDKNPEPHRAARLHYEIARQVERNGDEATATEHYRLALTKVSEHRPSLRALRQLMLRRRERGAIELFDAEAAIAGSKSEKVQLCLAKARALEEIFDDVEAARFALAEAAKLDPSDLGPLIALWQHAAAADRREALGLLERIANVIASDEPLKAVFLAEQARLAEHLGDAQRAQTLYHAALETGSLGALDACMRLAHAAGAHRELVALLERDAATTEDPAAKASTLALMARIHSYHLDNPEAARIALAAAVAVRPEDRYVLQALARLSDGEALGRVLEQLVPLARDDDERARWMHRLGEIYEASDPENSALWYESALTNDPRRRESLHGLERTYRTLGRWDALAKALARHAASIDDPLERAELEVRTARAFEGQGDRDAAIRHHARALGLDPERVDAFQALERTYRELGRFHEIIELHERGVEREPQFAASHLADIAAIQERDLQDPASALATYQRALEHPANHLSTVHAAQRAAERAGDHRQLLELLDREASMVSGPTRLHVMHRAAQVLEHHLDGAETALDRYTLILNEDPTHRPTLISLEGLCAKLGKSQAYVLERRLACTHDARGEAELHLRLARIAEAANERKKALAEFKKAIKADSSFGFARIELLDALRDRGDAKALVKALRDEMARQEAPAARADLALELAEACEGRLGDLGAAAAALEQALAARSDRFVSEWLARLRGALNAQTQLVEQLERDAVSVEDAPTAARKWLAAGHLWAGPLDRAERAIGAYEAVLAVEADNLEALVALEPLVRQAKDKGRVCEIARMLAAEARDERLKLAMLDECARFEQDPQAKRAALEAMLALRPDHDAALEALEQLALASQDAQLLALIDRRRADLRDPALAAAHLTRLGDTLSASDPRAAVEAYRAAVARDPQSLSAMRGLAVMAAAVGNAQLAVDAIEREASWLTDPTATADRLVEAAWLRTSQLDDREGALDNLERALARDPDHAQAAERLAALLAETGQHARLVDRLGRAAHNCNELARKVALWQLVARAQLDELNDAPAAIVSLERARRLDERHLPTMMHLAEAFERNAEWKKAVDVLEKALSMLPDAWNPAPLRLRVARLYAANEPAKALESLQVVLDRDPKHPEALELFLQLCAKSGDTEGARRAAHALLEAADGVPGRVAALTKIGELELEAGNPESATEALHMAVVLEGPGGAAANAYRKALGRREAQGRYVEAVTQHIERVRRGELVDAELGKSYLEVARIMREQLGDHTRALVALKRAVAQLPDDPTLGVELSEQLARMGRQAEATAELERQLMLDPSRAGAWRLMARLLQELGRPMDAALVVAPVMLFDKPSSVEKNLYQRGRDAPRDIRVGALSREWLDKVAKSSGEDGTVTELVQLLGEAFLKLRPFDASRWGLSSRDRLGPRDDHPLRAVLDDTLRVFGFDRYELYLHQKREPEVQAHGDRVPILVAPASLASRPPAQQRFLFARALVPFARGLAPALAFGTDELDKAIAAAIRGQEPNYLDKRFDESELTSIEKQLGRGLSRRNRKALANPANELVARRFDVAAWRETVEQSATFAAALYVGDLIACAEALRADGIEPQHRVSALVSFWGASRSFDLRRLAGLGPRA